MDNLLQQIDGKREPRARLQTLLHGWMAGFTASNRSGTQNAEVNRTISSLTPTIDASCDTVLAAQTPADQRSRLQALLKGWIASFSTANREGTQNPEVNKTISSLTPMIDQYCDRVLEGTGQSMKASAGVKKTA